MNWETLRTLLHEVDEAVFPSSIYCVCCGALIDRSRMYSLCDTCIRKFHWITGRTCEKCGKAMPDTSKGRLCYDCMQEKHFFRKGFSCLTYGLNERELMMDLKYAGKGYLARIFGDMMFDRLEAEIREGLFAPGVPGVDLIAPGVPGEVLFASGLREDSEAETDYLYDRRGSTGMPRDGSGVRIDLIVPVPVSNSRLRRRGYNQSAIMARQLTRRWRDCVREEREAAAVRSDEGRVDMGYIGTDLACLETSPALFPAPVCRTQMLYRGRETQMLRSLNPTERRMVMKDVFAVTEREKHRLIGRTVLLIDDIYTTGATADACSQTLLAGGAKEVYLLTLASGGNRRPGEV